MNITLVMSSSITTTLIMGVGLAVGAAVADGELGSVMGSMLLNVHVPTTHTTSHMLPDKSAAHFRCSSNSSLLSLSIVGLGYRKYCNID